MLTKCIAIVSLGLMLMPALTSTSASKITIRQAVPSNANINTSANEITPQQQENEIAPLSESRINLGEPYKSMVETALRFAIAQTKLPNHVSIEFTLHILKEIGYKLAKVSTLIKLMGYITFCLATLLTASFFFPWIPKFAESMWNDPINTLNLDKYLTNGLSERSVIGILGANTETMLKHVGLYDFSCRQRSICYMGEVLRCSSPKSAEALIKFGSDHFANTSLSAYPTVKSFLYGYVDRNCTSIPLETDESENCFRNLFNPILGPTNRQDKN